jgi:CHASE3 domain sensor protein
MAPILLLILYLICLLVAAVALMVGYQYWEVRRARRAAIREQLRDHPPTAAPMYERVRALD